MKATVSNDKAKKFSTVVIGFDNGSTGTICAFGDGKLIDFREQFSYKWRKPQVKSKDSYMSRICFKELREWVFEAKLLGKRTVAVIERPMTDETRLQQTISSHHSQEAIMIVLEDCGVEFMTVDSSEWQKLYLPGISGSKVLKLKSADLAKIEFPQFSALCEKHGDADAIYIAKMVVDDFSKFVPDHDRKAPVVKNIKKKTFTTNFSEDGKNEFEPNRFFGIV